MMFKISYGHKAGQFSQDFTVIHSHAERSTANHKFIES